MSVGTLDDYVTAAYRVTMSKKPNPAYVDFVAAFKASPDLLAEAQAEKDKLAAIDRAGSTFSRDYLSKARHDTLEVMIGRYQAQESIP